LLAGINDRDRLRPIADAKTQERIQEVRNAYQRLRKDEIDTREFYRASGINFPENKPLIE